MARATNDFEDHDTARMDASREFDYATLGDRFVATIVDDIVVPVIGYGLIFVGRALGASNSNPLALVTLLLAGGFALFYVLILEGVWGGQTLGKAVVDIRVVREDGEEIGVLESVVRNFIGILGQAFGLFGLVAGAIFISGSDRNQRLGDRVANTIVIRD